MASATNTNELPTDKKRYKCPIEGCNASYTKPCRLEVHRKKHTGERPFKCDIPGCSLSYTNPAHLKRHKCLVHEKSDEIICKVEGCGLVLSNRYTLKKHCSQKHGTNKYAFNCSQCTQGFKRKRHLQAHVCSHTGDLPFKCSICNMSFSKLHLCNKHRRNHKTYTCDCKMVFERWSLFCAHRRNSCTIKKIDHKCIICKKIFTTSTNLKTHSLIHLEESQRDNYCCPYLNCTRSYKYRKNLNYHITVFHKKAYNNIKCSEPGCEQILKSKKNLKQHMLKVHNSVPKEIKEREKRRDKGKYKKCMASIMSGVELPLEEHLALINNSGVNNSSATDTTKKNTLKLCGTEKVEKSEARSSSNLTAISTLDDNLRRGTEIGNCDSKHKTVKEKTLEEKKKLENVTSFQKSLENTPSTSIKENLYLQDDALMQYCDTVLEKLHGLISQTPIQIQI